MAVALDANATSPTRQASGTTLNNANLTVGSGSNRALIVQLCFSSVVTGISVKWDVAGANQTCTLIGSNTGPYVTYLYGLVAPASGNKTLSVSWTSTSAAEVNLASFTGVNQTGGATSFAHFSHNNSATTTASLAVTSATGNMAVDCVSVNVAPISAPTQTQMFLVGTAPICAGSYAAGAATVNFQWTCASATSWNEIGCDIVAGVSSTHTISNAGGNASSTAAWADAVVPTSGDSIIASGTSGQLTIDAAFPASGTLASVDFTGYTNTLTMTNTLSVAGPVTLASGMTISGSANLICSAAATLTFNLGGSRHWTGGLQLGAQAYTMTGSVDWRIDGNCTLAGSTVTISSNDIVVYGTTTISTASVINGGFNWFLNSLTTTGALTGTAIIVFGGGSAGTWQGAAACSNSVSIVTDTFNGTPQTLTLSGTALFAASGTPTLSYQAGILAGASTPILSIASACTISGFSGSTAATGQMQWGVTISANITITLSSDLNLTDLLHESAGACTFSGAYGIACNTWTIDGGTSGTTVIPSGSVSCSGLLTLGNTSATTFSGAYAIAVGSVTVSHSMTWTIAAVFYCDGLTTISATTVLNGSALTYWTEGITMSAALSGTAILGFSGGGTWSGGSNISNSVNINTAISGLGTFIISGTVSWGSSGAVFTYTVGTVTTTSSTLNVIATGVGGATLNTAGIIWNNVTITASENSPISLSSLLTVTGTLNLSGSVIYDMAFTGAAGFTCGTLNLGGYQFITLTAGNTYTIKTALTLASASLTSSHAKFTSSHATNKVTFILGPGATQSVTLVDFVRVDASGGQTIFTFNGVITTSYNIINSWPINFSNNDPSFHVYGI